MRYLVIFSFIKSMSSCEECKDRYFTLLEICFSVKCSTQRQYTININLKFSSNAAALSNGDVGRSWKYQTTKEICYDVISNTSISFICKDGSCIYWEMKN